MAAADSKMADMQNKVVVFLIQGCIFFYKKTKYILKVRSLKNIVIWIFKMAAPDSKMADMQNKVVVFIVQRYIFYNREAKYIFKRCTLKNMT